MFMFVSENAKVNTSLLESVLVLWADFSVGVRSSPVFVNIFCS